LLIRFASPSGKYAVLGVQGLASVSKFFSARGLRVCQGAKGAAVVFVEVVVVIVVVVVVVVIVVVEVVLVEVGIVVVSSSS